MFALGDLVKLLVEFANLVQQSIRKKNLDDLHSTIEKIKVAKTQEERDELAKKLATFWANPK